MKLSASERQYTVKKKPTDGIDPGWVFYDVEERDSERLSQFIVKLTHTQATRGEVEQDIVRWCEIYHDKLRTDGKPTTLDLDYVVRRVDRR